MAGQGRTEGDAATASDRLIELLAGRWGVRHVFGMPGDGINGVIEALRRRRRDIQFVQTRHEEAAAFAACGYAKTTGRLGVCITTSGPGAIHLLNGLYDAQCDRAPVLAITGLQYSDVIGTHFQQDVDTVGLIGHVATYSGAVMQPAHVENRLNMAVRYALSRREVAHIAIPIDVQVAAQSSARWSLEDQPDHTSGAWSVPRLLPGEEELERAAELLNAGRKVAIMVGAGARGARAEVEGLAERLGAPVGKAYLGKDAIPDDSPYTTMGVAIIGTAPSQDILRSCDTFLMIGTSMPYTAFYPKVGEARSVQIDADPARIGLRYPVEVGVAGDARETIRALLPLLKRNEDRSFLVQAQASMKAWNETMAQQEASRDVPMRPQVFAAAISRNIADNAIICGDVGQTTHWASRHIRIRGDQRFFCSGTLATMACGLPYAIGAQAAYPGRQVVAYVGDGALTMLMGELATAAKYQLPIKIFVSKNNVLGLIRWEQMLFLGNPEYAVDLQDIDYLKVAEACGLRAFRVERPEEADRVVKEALATPGPVLVEGIVDPFEPVMPGHLTQEQADHYGEAMRLGMRSGQPSERRIALTMTREISELAEADRERLGGSLKAKGLEPARGDAGAAAPSARTHEPRASFDLQERSGLERSSGQGLGNNER